MIRINNIQFQYEGNDQITYPDFECKAKEKILITGPSGCGKSTLMHLLAGFLQPIKGQIYVDDTLLHQLNSKKLDKFRAQNIGIVFQDHYFLQALTIQENLILAQTLSGRKKDLSRIQRLAEQLEIDHLLPRKPFKLSRGEQQRSSIVRSLINQPRVVLADEPTSSLDDINCDKVIDMLERLSFENNAALIVVTHDSRLKHKFLNQLNL